jgi:hypothetical protein
MFMRLYLGLSVAIGLIVAVQRVFGQQPTPAELTPAQRAEAIQIASVAGPKEFLELSKQFWDEERHGMSSLAKDEVRRILGERAKRTALSEGGLASLSVQEQQAILGWSDPVLTDAEKLSLQELIGSRYGDPQQLGFVEFQARASILSSLLPVGYEGHAGLRKSLGDWIESHQLSGLEPDQLDWCFRTLLPPVDDKSGFRAVWTGYLTPPRSGQYTFSVSPWKVSYENTEYGATRRYRQSMNVQVNGKHLVAASPEGWSYGGDGIELTAGQAVPVRIEFAYERNDQHRLCPVILYWRGPGTSESVVPASVFTRNEEGDAGLDATYVWATEDGDAAGVTREMSEQTVDPNVEFVWHDGLTVDARSMGARAIAQEFVNRWMRDSKEFADDLRRRPQMAALLTCDQLRSCLQALVSNEIALRSISPAEMQRLYGAVRCGAEEDAVELLGVWMTYRANDVPQVAADAGEYFRLNRTFYYFLSTQIGFENPEAMSLLEERFLETENGECCLPVAYALTEAYLLRGDPAGPAGEIALWIDKLEERLADESLVGDRRVSWLIARAHAEEVRYGRHGRHNWNLPVLASGRSWIDEARLVAESDPMRWRAELEYVTRLGTQGQIDEATKHLEGLGQPPSEAIAAIVRPMSERLVQLGAVKEQDAENQLQLQQDGYLQTIRDLGEQARARGDGAKAAQYESIIDQLSTPQQ